MYINQLARYSFVSLAYVYINIYGKPMALSGLVPYMVLSFLL